MFSTLLLVLAQPASPATIATSPQCATHLPALRAAFLEAGDGDFRFLRAAHSPSGLSKDEAVLWLGSPTMLDVGSPQFAHGEVRVATVNGDVRAVLPSLLTSARPANVVFPKAMPPIARDQPAMACQAPEAATELRAELSAFEAARTAAFDCADAKLAELDTTSAGAKHYDLVTRQGGAVRSVQNYESVLWKKAWAGCGGPAIDARERQLKATVNAAWSASFPAQLEAATKRVRALLKSAAAAPKTETTFE